MLIQINNAKPVDLKKFALFNLGFRPFFLGAGLFAIVSMLTWLAAYTLGLPIETQGITLSQWHAHEMLYGYGLAVAAGFLLTAVKNWTGVPTAQGKSLASLFGLWCVARILLLFGTDLIAYAATADVLFGLGLLVAILKPIIQVKQWMQLAVAGKVLMLWIGNIVFYLGCFGLVNNGMLYAINGAVLLFIGLILTIGRRVIPFFIERGVGGETTLKQFKWLDLSIMMALLALFANVIFFQIPHASSLCAIALFVLNSTRLFNWHTAGVWRIPLLWSLYLSFFLINVGFLFYALETLAWWDKNSLLPILTMHLFTVGGIGLVTLSMMARVSLGHTGRDIRKPSHWMIYAFAGLIASALFRSVMPMLAPQLYAEWVLLAGILWIVCFSVFTVIYAPILWRIRVDGAWG
ncbi:MAG: NnrS family protein [Betaproteobacteria bacterium]|nr:NnrS family protein [Betaproteobacteria bacterium]